MLLKMRENVLGRLEAIDMVEGIKMAIGDDIGTDSRLHCGPGVAGRVWDYLVLTT